jgi:glycosyltransferase involved in cell wall biosynthesis
MLKVSIVIPVYNVEEYVAECIESVKAQRTEFRIECIIVDDKGKDRSMDMVRESLRDYQGPVTFRILEHAENRGLSAARNTGIAVATGDYFYFLDSDDMIAPDAIQLLGEQVKLHPQVDLVVGWTKCFPTPDMENYFSQDRFIHPQYTDDTSIIQGFYFQMPDVATTKLFRRDFLLSQGKEPFKVGFIHEDFHLHLRLYFYIQSIAFVNRLTYYYRIRSGSIMRSETQLEFKKWKLTIYKDVICSEYKDRSHLALLMFKLGCEGLIMYKEGDPILCDYYVATVNDIIHYLPAKERIPFYYLRLRRPWMQYRILRPMCKMWGIGFRP